MADGSFEKILADKNSHLSSELVIELAKSLTQLHSTSVASLDQTQQRSATADEASALFDVIYAPLPSDVTEEHRRPLTQLISDEVFSVVTKLKGDFIGCSSVFLGGLRPQNALTSGIIELSGGSAFRIGPPAYDLGVLIAHWLMWEHAHMTTELDNDAHRIYSHKLATLGKELLGSYELDQSAEFMSRVAGFAGCEMARSCRAVMEQKEAWPYACSRTHGLHDMLDMAARLITAAHRIHDPNRLHVIATMEI